MKAEIITIGDEILIGQIIDSNSAWLGQKLNEAGISVNQITSISDEAEHIIKAVSEAEQNVDLVLITGGLGPTKDDITKVTLAKHFNSELIHNESVLQNISNLLEKWGRKTIDLNKGQAMVPACCTVLNNEVGTAPGMWFEHNNTIFVSMPGVPSEMKWLMTNAVFPLIKEQFQTPNIIHRTVLTFGVPESILAEKLTSWENNLPADMKLAYLPSIGTVRLRISVVGDNEATINKRIDKQVVQLKAIIPETIYGYGTQTLEEVVGILLKEKKATMATAESCTGGNIAQLITSIAGSSEYYKGSVVAYSNGVKSALLNVDKGVLVEHGAVSEPVVRQMAENARKILSADYAISISGIAGPGGGTDEKPVGSVWVAVASPDGCIAKQFQFSRDRSRNIRMASLSALNLLRCELLGL